jgi:hypothetical protein
MYSRKRAYGYAPARQRTLRRPNYGLPETRRATPIPPRHRPLRSEYREQPKGCAVRQQNAPKETSASQNLTELAPGIAQIPTATHVDADVTAIRELRKQIEYVWEHLAAACREGLSTRLDLLWTAADSCATDSRAVREALQEVLLSVGTGALAALSEPTRRRLAALTGIEVPDRLPPVDWRTTGGPQCRTGTTSVNRT